MQPIITSRITTIGSIICIYTYVYVFTDSEAIKSYNYKLLNITYTIDIISYLVIYSNELCCNKHNHYDVYNEAINAYNES